MNTEQLNPEERRTFVLEMIISQTAKYMNHQRPNDQFTAALNSFDDELTDEEVMRCLIDINYNLGIH